MRQFPGTELQARQKRIKKQAEIELSGHFLHSYFELTWIEISQARVQFHLNWLHKYSPPLHLDDL